MDGRSAKSPLNLPSIFFFPERIDRIRIKSKTQITTQKQIKIRESKFYRI
uniref:Uncharacterized protein n=1 Tax=Leptospira santarosai serovar Arenal str. MAVJ 401 TaxID=1049976 RepID=M6JRA0_9LEPT|nr:hypothetical protein LEP1GSC063_4328 [Leptospira santarosai serovar Arenal str. MAVJ 401]